MASSDDQLSTVVVVIEIETVVVVGERSCITSNKSNKLLLWVIDAVVLIFV